MLRIYKIGGAVSEMLYAPALGALPLRAPHSRLFAQRLFCALLSEVVRLSAAVPVGPGFAPTRSAPVPYGRINAAAAVAGSVLWLFGGMVEVGDREITFDDLWSLDLSKLTGWCEKPSSLAGALFPMLCSPRLLCPPHTRRPFPLNAVSCWRAAGATT